MKTAFQMILIIGRLWPLLAVGAVISTAAQNSPQPKTDQGDYRKLEGIKVRELVERVRPLASK